MTWVRRGAVAIAVMLVASLGAAPFYLLFAGWRSFPIMVGELEVEGLESSVEVRRDSHGIPVIFASSSWDLWFSQGYVHAQDRFWEMDFRRHVTAGRTAELFGSGQVDTDAFVRTLGWRRIAEQELELIDDETRHMLEAYSAGVNAWLDGRRGTSLSFEHALLPLTGAIAYRPEPWEPADSVAWIKAMAWDLAGIEDEILRARLSVTDLGPDRSWRTLYPTPPDEHPPIIPAGGSVRDGRWVAHVPGAVDDRRASESADQPPLVGEPDPELLAMAHEALRHAPTSVGSHPGVGSNAWVVAGERTASGSPMLANDPHLEPGLPSVWHQVGLRCRPVGDACPYEVTGFSFAGLPGVVIGHTNRAAWGLSNLAASGADLVVERIDSDTYLDGDDARAIDTRTETIRVAMGRDVDVTIRSTRNGPLISDVSDDAAQLGSGPLGDEEDRPAPGQEHALALRWVALEPGRTAEAIPRFARLSSWPELLEIAELFEVPSQNIVYADVDGHIGFVASGRLPVRDSDGPVLPIRGWAEDATRTDELDQPRRPWMLDPAEGMIVTANQPILPRGDEPMLEDRPNMGYRAARITELLHGSRRLRIEDMTAIQLDDRNANADHLIGHLLAVETDDATVGTIQRLLADWDRHDDAGSAGAAAFNAVWRHLLAHTFHDELPEWAHPDGSARWWEVVRDLLEHPEAAWWDDLTTLEALTRDDVLEAAMGDAHVELTQRFGADTASWRWGAMHRLELVHASFGRSGIRPIERLFNRGPLELSGGKDVVNATGWDAAEGYEVDAAPSMRMVVDLGDLDRGQWIHLGGQSGRTFHHHYADQARLWADGAYVPLVHSDDVVRDVHWRELVLAPPCDHG